MAGALEYWTGKPVEPREQKLLDDVREYGCQVLVVRGEAGAPGWAYSVGLFEGFDHPEVVVFGLPQQVAHWVINELMSRIRSGERFAAGSSAMGLLEGGFICQFKAVERSWYEALLGRAQWFYRCDEFPAVQCVWPDKQGRYPWDDDFNSRWTHVQPMLHLTDPDEARMRATLESFTGLCSCSERVNDWKFQDDPHLAAITQQHVMSGERPILLVSHDAGDGRWQFSDGSDSPSAPVVVCMHHLVELDSALNDLADLPLGWQAWRTSQDEPWRRAPCPDE